MEAVVWEKRIELIVYVESSFSEGWKLFVLVSLVHKV